MQHYKPPGAVKKQESHPQQPGGPGGKDPNANPEDQKTGGGGDKSRRNRNKNKQQQQQNGNKGEGDVDKLAERVGGLNVDEAGSASDKAGQQRGNNKRGKKPEQGRFIRKSEHQIYGVDHLEERHRTWGHI